LQVADDDAEKTRSTGMTFTACHATFIKHDTVPPIDV